MARTATPQTRTALTILPIQTHSSIALCIPVDEVDEAADDSTVSKEDQLAADKGRDTGSEARGPSEKLATHSESVDEPNSSSLSGECGFPLQRKPVGGDGADGDGEGEDGAGDGSGEQTLFPEGDGDDECERALLPGDDTCESDSDSVHDPSVSVGIAISSSSRIVSMLPVRLSLSPS